MNSFEVINEMRLYFCPTFFFFSVDEWGEGESVESGRLGWK